jgi:hypothetical protein
VFPRLLLRFALLAAFALALAAPQAHAAGWLPPVDVGAGGNAFIYETTVDGTGAVWVAWIASNKLFVSKRPTGGSFEAPQELDSASGTGMEMEIGADSAGNAVVLWRNPTAPGGPQVRVAQRSAGGSAFGPFGIVSQGFTPETSLKMVVSGSGKIAAAWVSGAGGPIIRTAFGTTGGALATTSYAASGGESVGPPAVAINEAGEAIAAWRTFGSSSGDFIRTSYRTTEDAQFPPPSALQVADNNMSSTFGDPSLTIDAAGNAVGSWTDSVGARLKARLRSASSGLWTDLNDLDANGSFSKPVLGVDAGGSAQAVWQPGSELRTAFRPPGGGFGPSPGILLAGASEGLAEFAGAASSGGGLALVWKSVNGDQPVRAIVRPSTGPFGPITTISAPGHGGDQPKVGIAGAAGAAAVWRDDDGSNQIVMSAVYDAKPPSFSSVDVPATGTAGSAAAFTAAAADDWSVPTVTWDFGDGTSGTGTSVSHTYAAAGKYTVATTATDSVGNVALAAHTIDVAAAQGPPGPPPPVDPPTRGVDFNASTVSGTVLVSVPKNAPAGRVLARRPVARAAAAITPPRGFTPFRELGKNDSIPVGSILDASRGISSITMAANAGGTKTQKGNFSKGVFRTKQSKASPLTTATMLGGGNFKRDCKKPKARAGSAGATAARRRPSRRLFANVKGRFRTRGRHSTATVRGTQYLVKDTCAGTLTSVLKGSVVVRDLVKKRSRVVKAGHRYLAKPRPLRRRSR